MFISYENRKPEFKTLIILCEGKETASGNGMSLNNAKKIYKEAEYCPCCFHKAMVNNACLVCDHNNE